MDAFKIVKNGKVLDYRVGATLDLEEVRKFFSETAQVIDLQQHNRHVIGKLKKDDREFILKLSTTEGISARTETEKIWNDEYNKWSGNDKFVVPQNRGNGYYNGLYYLIMDYFTGPEIASFDKSHNLIEKSIDEIINFSEHIQSLTSMDIPINDAIQNVDHRVWFCEKTKSWFDAIPAEIQTRHGVDKLWQIAQTGSVALEKKPRHGDFTPWHLISIDERNLGLLDGEHAHSHGVEYYDISYFIQRVHSILEEPPLALKIYNNLIARNYDKKKLQTVLASRAIGGFLDESFKQNPDYESEVEFKNWVVNL